MKTHLPLYLLFLVCSNCVQRGTTKPTSSDFGQGTCTLENLEWNTVVEGFDQEKSLKILSDLKAAAEVKQNQVISTGKFDAEFSSAFNNIIKVTNRKEFKVSQDVQDLMMKIRRLGCDLQAGLFQGNEKAAQQKYLDLLDQVDVTKKKLEPTN